MKKEQKKTLIQDINTCLVFSPPRRLRSTERRGGERRNKGNGEMEEETGGIESGSEGRRKETRDREERRYLHDRWISRQIDREIEKGGAQG